MKLQNVNEQLEQIKLNRENKKAILKLIDLKIEHEAEKYTLEIKGLHFRMTILAWALSVIVLGFLSKLLIGG